MKEEHTRCDLRVEVDYMVKSNTGAIASSPSFDLMPSPEGIREPIKSDECTMDSGDPQLEHSNSTHGLTVSPSKSENYSREARNSISRCTRLNSGKLKIQCSPCFTNVIHYNTEFDDWLQKIYLQSILQSNGAIKFGGLSKQERNGLILSLEKAVLEEITVEPLDPCFGHIYLIYDNFKDFYSETKTLGQGSSAVVKKCVGRTPDTAGEVAVKISDYMGDDERLIQTIKGFKMRKALNHPNIVKTEALYIDLCKKKTYLVMHLAEGGDLKELLSKVKRLEDREAARIFNSILLGAQYLHRQGVCHRDLKLDNILFEKESRTVKITDFGVSKYFKEHEVYSGLRRDNYQMWTFTGTVAYLPPEVFKDLEYTESIDSWGAGVMLYTMLTSSMPFYAEDQDKLIEHIVKGKYDTESPEFKRLSPNAKHLISCLLERDPKRRYTLFQAGSHPWISANTTQKRQDKECPSLKRSQSVKSLKTLH